MIRLRNETCEGCKFWQWGGNQAGNRGICHRMPPTAIMVPMEVTNAQGERGMQMVPNALFPATQSDQWCGEYVTKIEL